MERSRTTLLGPVMEMVMLVRCGEMLVRPTTWTLVSVWWRGGWAGIQTQPSLLSLLIEVVGRPQAAQIALHLLIVISNEQVDLRSTAHKLGGKTLAGGE